MNRETALKVLAVPHIKTFLVDGEPNWSDGVTLLHGYFTADQLRALLWFHDQEGAK